MSIPTLIPALSALSLTPPSAPSPAYIYALSQLPSLSQLAALTSSSLSSSSTSHLHLLSPTLTPVHTFTTPHNLLLSHTPSTLLTSGGTLTLTLHDPRTPTRPIQTFHAPASVLSIAVSPTGLIAAGTELASSTASVLVFDVRTPQRPLRVYAESHNDDVTTLSFSGTELVSGGTDGIVTVFDTSVAAGAEGEGDDEVDGAVRTVVNHGSSVHRAKIFGEDLWAVSHDEVLGVYGERGEGEKWDAGDVRRVTEAEYVVDVLPRVGGGWVVAGNKEGQWVDFCGVGRKAGAWGWGERWRLVGGHGEEVCRDVLVDEGSNTVYTCGEDGMVKSWRPPTMGSSDAATTEVEMEEGPEEREETKEERRERRRLKKERKAAKEEKKRFAPY